MTTRRTERSVGDIAHRSILVLAKAPEPGRVKTRLVPPLTHDQAAALAEAALADTLDAVLACRAERRILVLEGSPGPWLPAGIDVQPQRGEDLADRLAAAWSTVTAGSTLQIGMDTPQLTGADLDEAFETLERPGVDAVLGPAADGGWWAIGMRRPDPSVFAGIPTSTADTGRLQQAALEGRGWRVACLPVLQDVDTGGDVAQVAGLALSTRFAREASRLGLAVDGARAGQGVPR